MGSAERKAKVRQEVIQDTVAEMVIFRDGYRKVKIRYAFGLSKWSYQIRQLERRKT